MEVDKRIAITATVLEVLTGVGDIAQKTLSLQGDALLLATIEVTSTGESRTYKRQGGEWSFEPDLSDAVDAGLHVTFKTVHNIFATWTATASISCELTVEKGA